ncbi:MAG: DUF1015 domain-containing protein [Spirochaetaceae bacterium]|jgi:hypothetical protein|nr:DUF1015 domain-containing protein [Spirochaetaceae bacterium]
MEEALTESTRSDLAKLGVAIPEIMLPSKNIDIEKWAVIACDQFTQDKHYWKSVKDFTGSSPSTLQIIFPECFLDEDGKTERINKIHDTMNQYLNAKSDEDENPVLLPRRGGVFVERQCKHGIRKGLILAVDLEKYDWHKGTESLIRASEETIFERILPRMDIRMGAPLESPHILLLIDDKANVLMQVLEMILVNAPFAYDAPLMMESGAVRGRLLYRKNDWGFIAEALEHLYRKSYTYFKSDFLFAVGDGNHSLATAKEVWEDYKKEHKGDPCLENHPARFALAEIVNLYDSAIVFEPIHRLLINVPCEAVLESLRKLPEMSSRKIKTKDELISLVEDRDARGNRYGLISKDSLLLVESCTTYVSTIDLEPLLQDLVKEHQAGGAAIDYIHGTEELFHFARESCDPGEAAQEHTGILLPPFKKEGFFKSVVKNGLLPRKSFSMGDACEKRFYLECRKLFC